MFTRLLVALAVLALATAAGAQIGGGSGSWVYPAEPGRDPMQPPAELYQVAGRAQLSVEVIIASPRRSRALVRLGAEGPYSVVGAGDRVGDYRIVEVTPESVVAVLSALGAERRLSVAPADTAALARTR